MVQAYVKFIRFSLIWYFVSKLLNKAIVDSTLPPDALDVAD